MRYSAYSELYNFVNIKFRLYNFLNLFHSSILYIFKICNNNVTKLVSNVKSKRNAFADMFTYK